MKTVHLGFSTAYAPRKSKTVSSSIMVVEGGRTSAVSNAVVQPGIRIKAVPILLVAKLVIDAVDWVYNIRFLWSR